MTGEALNYQFPLFPGNHLPSVVVQSGGAAGLTLMGELKPNDYTHLHNLPHTPQEINPGRRAMLHDDIDRAKIIR